MTPRSHFVAPGRRTGASGGRSRSWGGWIVSLSVLSLAAVGATVTWTRRVQVTSIPSPPPVAIPEVPVAQSTPAETASGDATARMLASAPELNQRSAEMLLTSRVSPTEEGLAESTLGLAAGGFERLDRTDVRELGDLFSQVYAGLGVADRQWMSVYVDKMRSVSLSPEESRRGRELLTVGIKSLPQAKRLRLQALLEKAIAGGLRRRREAEDRQREAGPRIASNEPGLRPAMNEEDPMPAVATVPFSAPTASPPPPQAVGGSGQQWRAGSASREPAEASARGESYWRSRMEQARARVSQLEAEVKQLDEKATASAFGTSTRREDGYNCDPPGQRIRGKEDEQAIADCLRRLQNEPLRQQAERGQILDRLETARRQLAEAKRALEDLEEEARRAGALPGWLR